MCPIRATVIEVEFLTDTMLAGGPHTDAVEMLGEELVDEEPLDDEPPPEQATTKVLNKKMATNNLV
ncbi:MAG: hypothetical protein HOP32_02620 [Nitrospira sp.]|nr:hypothetical protein [Nitrospira sp.]